MKLSKKALKMTDNLETRLKLALLFKVTERRVSQLIKANKPFGPLVSQGALDLIKQETGLSGELVLEKTEVAA